MPATRQIAGPRGPGFWSSFDPNDCRLVQQALKEEFQRSEPAHDIHYCHGGSDHMPPHVLNVKFGVHCLRDCLVFLLRGVIFIDGQGAIVEPGYAYAVRDEEMIGLGGNTTVFIMEEGEMKGICAQKTKESQEKYWAEEKYWAAKEAGKRRQDRLWNRVLAKFRREPQEQHEVQCPTQ